VTVAPRIDVRIDPGMEVWPVGAPGIHRYDVTLTNRGRDTTSGTVTVEVPQGWPAIPPQPFRFTRENDHEAFVFNVRQPAALPPAPVSLRAVARDVAGRRYDIGVVTVDYPHVRPRSYLRPATAIVRPAAIRLPPLRSIGYVRGASDRVPEALRGVGLPITVLDGPTLDHGDLDRFQAIVIGPRAYETDSALVDNSARLLAYARRGGLVLVQYQQRPYFDGGYAPYPMTLADPHDRVTDETAPVTIVARDELLLRGPNRIESADWDGWVQERGLYFARTWANAYHPVISTRDPGETPLEGGLLVAPLGKGRYVYTGLSFFRQLPAGVPGAFRLFANLLALAAPAGR
jgi:hypothetical protein